MLPDTNRKISFHVRPNPKDSQQMKIHLFRDTSFADECLKLLQLFQRCMLLFSAVTACSCRKVVHSVHQSVFFTTQREVNFMLLMMRSSQAYLKCVLCVEGCHATDTKKGNTHVPSVLPHSKPKFSPLVLCSLQRRMRIFMGLRAIGGSVLS